MRGLIRALAPYFRLVFASGPFDCQMHPDLVPYYGGFTGVKRWTRWLKEDPPISNQLAIARIERCLLAAMDADEGTGEWVGLLGFSQGAKVSASILYDIQLRKDEQDREALDDMYGDIDTSSTPVGFAGARWKFAIIMAGRPPFISLSHLTKDNKQIVGAGELFIEHEQPLDGLSDRLRLPTLHVHGLQDPGLELHRKMRTAYCDPNTAKLIEWEAAHRIVFKAADVQKVTQGILEVAKVGNELQDPFPFDVYKLTLSKDAGLKISI